MPAPGESILAGSGRICSVTTGRMGIRTDAFIAPEKPVLLPREAFGRLVVDLARERVVRTGVHEWV
ncbi:hypothetical protein GCM10010217_42960 [Streptomyces tubercidicus]